MYLFDSLHMASAALSASQLGLTVAGQNLSNVNTPGYVRETLQLTTGTARKTGNGTNTGTGVNVSGIVQVIDQFLEERLRTSTSDAVASSTMQKYYTQLEALLNETTSSDLSTAVSDFFNSIDNILNQPENATYRKMAVEQGMKLADAVNRLAGGVVQMQIDINRQISDSANEVNRLLKEVESLNTNIAMVERQGKDAVGLRDQRLVALTELSRIVNIKTTEDAKTGLVSVYCGSDILLSAGYRAEITIGVKSGGKSSAGQNEVPMAQLCVGKEQSPLDVRSGSVYGLYESHQTVLGGYLGKLDTFAEQLITEFNKIYASGQGLTGYDSLTSLAAAEDVNIPINDALGAENLRAGGVSPPVQNGGFIVQIYNNRTGITTEHYIEVRVNDAAASDPFSLKAVPAAGGTSFQELADAINAIDGITAAVNTHGQLEIKSESTNVAFAFAQDTSGVLSALGMNTFFTGTSAGSIGINQHLVSDPEKFAASGGGVGADTEVGVLLAALGITPNSALGGSSLIGRYDGIVAETQLAAATVKAAAASDVLYQESLQAQRDSISGVNVDEETILMMTYQRMFQANSRLVTMVGEMMETLIAM